MNTILRSLSILLFISGLLVACGDGGTSDEHVDTANIYIKEGKYPEAIIELKNALKKDDSNARARLALGTLYFDRAYYRDADKELSKALASGMDPAAIVPVLAQVLLGLGETDRLAKLSSEGLDAESRSTLLATQGVSKLYRNDLEGATELIDSATKNEPTSNFAQVAAARLAMVKGDPDAARTRLNSIIAATPEFAPAWNLLGDIERLENHPEAAEKAYTKAIKITKDSFEPQLNRAMLRISMKNFEGAEEDMTDLETNYSEALEHPGVQFARALIYMQTERVDDAIEALQQASKFAETYPETLYYLAAIYAEKGQVEQALLSVNEYLGLKPQSVDGAILAAKMELHMQNFRNAERFLLPVVSEHENDLEALNLLADARLAQGKTESTVELLKKVVELQPKSKEAKARLGAAYLTGGSEELGIETLKGILADDPGYDEADKLIVTYYLGQKKGAKAIQAAQEYIKHNPGAKSYVLLAQTYVSNNDMELAKGAFTKALELEPGDPVAGSSLAGFAVMEKDYDAAREYYRQVLEQNPDHMDTHVRIAATFAMEGKDKEMLDSLDATLAAYPQAMEPRLVKARYYISKGKMEKAISLLEALSEKQKEHPEALQTQAMLELATNQFNQALATIAKLIVINPDSAEYHYMKSRAYSGLEDKEKLASELEQTLALDPNHFNAKLALARLALISDDALVFEDRLAELKKIAPNSSDVVQLEVAYAYKKGDNQRAEQLQEDLFKREPTTTTVVALATIRQSSGDVEGAIAQLQRWIEQNAKDVEAREKLAEVYGSINQVDDVMLQCREILKLEPDNMVALNNLAWHLLDEDPKQALVYAKKAVALSPESIPILDTLAMAQLRANDISEARATIDRALAVAPKSPELRFHEARIRAAEGDKGGAIVALSALLKKDEEFSERKAAERFLESLKAQEG